MKPTVRSTSAAIAAIAAAGVSSVFLGASPAQAATEACGATGALISAGVCEQTFTSGTSTFTPTPAMTKLEVLLVGAGGAGADQPVATSGYAAAGGGGQVTVVDFSGSTSPITVTVPAPGTLGSVTDGTTTANVANGFDGAAGVKGSFFSSGGNSGTGKAGATSGASGGGGASAASTTANGGAGVVVSSLVTPASLFGTDANCYGGGGAAGDGSLAPPTVGTASCGGGAPSDATATGLVAPTANSGGGGGGLDITQPLALRQGASGLVVIRWSAATVTLSFDSNGHGTAPAPQSIVAGSTATKPADPTAGGFKFGGWFTDAALTSPADFSAPVTASTTYFAKWSPVLAATGVEVAPGVVPLTVGALIAGAGLIALGARRRRAS